MCFLSCYEKDILRCSSIQANVLPFPNTLIESQTSPSECAKQREGQDDTGEAAWPVAETTAAEERQAQLRAIASDLHYWEGSLKVLRQARLPKWRGSFQWQIEAKIEALQAECARLRAEGTPEGG